MQPQDWRSQWIPVDEDAPPQPANSKAWMVTFTDLVSLMLTFFVLLFSMSSVKVDRWEQMIDALSQSLNPTRPETVVAATAQFNVATTFRKWAINLDYLTSILGEAMNRDPVLSKAKMFRLEDRLVIAMPGDLAFEPGRAVMTPAARDALFALGGLLRNLGNAIAVSGHSDPTPPSGGAYASNWELSLARAVAVANSLRRAGYPGDITSFGHAEGRYTDLPDLPDQQRREAARRVDIMIMADTGRK